MNLPMRSNSALLVGLIISSAIAYWWPNTWTQRWDQWQFANEWLQAVWANRLLGLVAVTMFAIGTLLTGKEVVGVVRRWPAVLAGTAIQYTVMPLLAVSIATLWQLDGPALVGVMVVGCVPGAMASNVLTLVARGNTSYSVSLTTLATLISPAFVPFVLKWTLGKRVEFDVWQTSQTLAGTVVLPVVLGFVARTALHRRASWIEAVARVVANGAILLIIAMVVADNRPLMARVSLPLLIPLLIINLGGYAAGYTGGWVLGLPEGMRRALTVEVGMQNAGLGAALAARLFGTEASVAPAIYTFGCMLTGTLLAWLWACRIPGNGEVQ